MGCDNPDIERIFAAFEHRKYNRVPNFEILIEDKHTSRLLGRTVGHTLGSAKGASEDEYVNPPMDAGDYIEICRLIGQDAIGMEALWAPLKKVDDKGVQHIITDGSIHTWEQLDNVIPHSNELDIEPKRKYLRQYIKESEDTGIGTTLMTAAPIMTPYQFIVGFEEFMVKLITDRDFIEKVIALCMDYYLEIIKMACEEGISWIYIGDDVGGKGGLLMGPDLTRKYAIPCYEQIVNLCSNYNIPVSLHSCGNAVEIIPDLIEIGIVMYNPVEPTSGADIYEVNRKYGDKICFSGNIDIADVLALGTPVEVEKDVAAHIKALAKNGGYILTSSHSITNDVPFENFMSMIASGHRYGRYPLAKNPPLQKDCYAAAKLEEIKIDRRDDNVEPKRFTPLTRYGVCVGCGMRKVTFKVPGEEMLCEHCFDKRGWMLVHDGPESGWRKRDGQHDTRIC